MLIRLVSPQVWQPLLEREFRTLEPEKRIIAEATLRAFHDRHIGITPRIAAELAATVSGGKAGTREENVWGRAIRRLQDEMEGQDEEGGGDRRQAAIRFGIVPAACRMYFVFRLAMPLVEFACRKTGRNLLFCADTVKSGISAHVYESYGTTLYRQLANATVQNGGPPGIFWKSRAYAISGFTRSNATRSDLIRGGLFRRTTAALPEDHPAELAMMLRLTSDEQKADNDRRKRLANLPFESEKSTKRRENEVRGYHSTLRPEDLPAASRTEHCYPKALKARRMLHDGFFAVERQPRREKPNHFLSVAFMPPGLHAAPARAFLKACWFDAVAKLGADLYKRGLVKSQFWFNEGVVFGKDRTCSYRLEDLPRFDADGLRIPRAWFRNVFMSALGWFPCYLDKRGGYSFPPDSAGNTKVFSGSKNEAGQTNWAYNLWKRLETQTRAGAAGDLDRNGLDCASDSFRLSHLMLFLPLENGHGGKGDGNGRLAHPRSVARGFAVSDLRTRNVSVVRVSSNPADGSSWSFQDARFGRQSVFAYDKKEGIREMASRLASAWHLQWSKEIWNE